MRPKRLRQKELHTHTHARTHARTHAHTHTRTHTQPSSPSSPDWHRIGGDGRRAPRLRRIRSRRARAGGGRCLRGYHLPRSREVTRDWPRRRRARCSTTTTRRSSRRPQSLAARPRCPRARSSRRSTWRPSSTWAASCSPTSGRAPTLRRRRSTATATTRTFGAPPGWRRGATARSPSGSAGGRAEPAGAQLQLQCRPAWTVVPARAGGRSQLRSTSRCRVQRAGRASKEAEYSQDFEKESLRAPHSYFIVIDDRPHSHRA